jgi:carbamoyl-phosphate synthase small subunit
MAAAYLVLQNGMIFKGERFGSERDSIGELVFTTGMCGYVETLTDPSYAGQTVLQTFPLIGNYGIIPEDFEGATRVSGYVVREWCDSPSNFRCGCTLDDFLKENDVPGIWGVDTREITRIIRNFGVMNAAIVARPPIGPDDPLFEKLKAYTVKGVLEQVTSHCPETIRPEKPSGLRVALMDYGYKANIAVELLKRGCEVTVFPASAKAEEILSGKYDGIMLSNGPGDPAENLFQIAQIKKMLGRLPLFGICLGHQLTALAAGGNTFKLKFGHRGVNQPVKDLRSGRTYITSQNHGYAVESSSVPGGRLSFVNANDGTCEGIDYPELQAFTVQFHPEARSGPKDTEFLFDRFMDMMKGAGSNAT